MDLNKLDLAEARRVLMLPSTFDGLTFEMLVQYELASYSRLWLTFTSIVWNVRRIQRKYGNYLLHINKVQQAAREVIEQHG